MKRFIKNILYIVFFLYLVFLLYSIFFTKISPTLRNNLIYIAAGVAVLLLILEIFWS
ncbi:MAG: hypothetical protein RMJ67_08650 [Elusimicrobiota bacterium]|nr:hypothetical protein [Endomicrobiia bacterium]MDW8166564.1 hypothetical protein [Elusimicrobiota bacterium]